MFVIRAMSRNPELSVVPDRSEKDKGDALQEEVDEEEDEEEDGDDDNDEGDDEEEGDEDEDENDDDIGEAAVPVGSLPAYTPFKQTKKGDKGESKTSVASDTHTPSSSSSVSKGRDSTGRSAVKGKSTLHNERTVGGGKEGEGKGEAEGEGEGEEEAVDGCRWVMQRLKGLGSDPRGRKRLHVIRVSTYIRICQSLVVSLHHYLLSLQCYVLPLLHIFSLLVSSSLFSFLSYSL